MEQTAAVFIIHGPPLTQTVIEMNVFISISKSVLLSSFILQSILMPQDLCDSFVPESPDENYLAFRSLLINLCVVALQ